MIDARLAVTPLHSLVVESRTFFGGQVRDLVAVAKLAELVELQDQLDRQFGIADRKLKLDSLWVNILKPGGTHSGHIHPHSVVSGTIYIEVPTGSGGIRFEDPRLPMMMAAPTRLPDAPEERRPFVTVAPQVGTILLWESWLRHEVEANGAKAERISISFNYS